MCINLTQDWRPVVNAEVVNIYSYLSLRTSGAQLILDTNYDTAFTISGVLSQTWKNAHFSRFPGGPNLRKKKKYGKEKYDLLHIHHLSSSFWDMTEHIVLYLE